MVSINSDVINNRVNYNSYLYLSITRMLINNNVITMVSIIKNTNTQQAISSFIILKVKS